MGFDQIFWTARLLNLLGEVKRESFVFVAVKVQLGSGSHHISRIAVDRYFFDIVVDYLAEMDAGILIEGLGGVLQHRIEGDRHLGDQPISHTHLQKVGVLLRHLLYASLSPAYILDGASHL